MTRASCRSGCVFRTVAAAAAWAQPAQPRRYAAQILDQAGKTLAARQSAVERGHGAREPRVIIMDPGAQNAAEQGREPLGPDHAARPRCADSGGREHPLL